MLITEKIKIKIVTKNTNHFICDRCGEIKNITYQEYLNQRKKFDFDTCNKCEFEKNDITNLEKLGVPYPTMSKDVTDKTLETNIKNGRWLKVEDRDDYYNYYLSVYGETLKNKKELLSNWNGYDYYSTEYILENFKLDSNDKKYPTIDHKNSIRYGFDNNISTVEISRIENLCITTRSNNSSKNKKIESEFNIIQYDNKI